jgi:hypothetical protein
MQKGDKGHIVFQGKSMFSDLKFRAMKMCWRSRSIDMTGECSNTVEQAVIPSKGAQAQEKVVFRNLNFIIKAVRYYFREIKIELYYKGSKVLF